MPLLSRAEVNWIEVIVEGVGYIVEEEKFLENHSVDIIELKLFAK